jgi:hypothetical protein
MSIVGGPDACLNGDWTGLANVLSTYGVWCRPPRRRGLPALFVASSDLSPLSVTAFTKRVHSAGKHALHLAIELRHRNLHVRHHHSEKQKR